MCWRAEKEPPPLPVAAGEMSPLGTDVVAAEVGQPLQVANGASPSEIPLDELCQSVQSMDVLTESDDGCTVDNSICNWIQAVIGTALTETHQMDILIDAVNELAPSTNWVHVMENKNFIIPSGAALNLMMSMDARVFKESAPLDVVCSQLWKNTEGQNCLKRFIDMCQGLEIMSAVLESTPFPLKIKLASAASRKDPRLIENWLGVKLDGYKQHFLKECVNLLKELMSNSPTEQPQADVMSMYWGSFPLFVEVCRSHSGELLHTQQLEEQVRELTLKHLLRAGSFDIIKNEIVMLQKERQFSKDLIIEEERMLSMLKNRIVENPLTHRQPGLFQAKYGTSVLKLRSLAQSNDEALKYLRKGLLKYFNGDPLFFQIEDILKRNRAASKKAALIIVPYYDYVDRANIEMLWIDSLKQKVNEASRFLSGCDSILAKLERTERHICDIKRTVSLLSKEHTQNLYSQCQSLDMLAKLWGEIGMVWNKLALLSKAAKDACVASEDLRFLFREKLVYATRFHQTEQLLKEEKESSKIYQELTDIKFQVFLARISCREKLNMYPEVSETDKKYERILVGKAMSWKTRGLFEWDILGELRDQGRDMCAFVSTIVMRESLGKREDALSYLVYRPGFRVGDDSRPIKHFTKLSEHHLQDIVRAFFARNNRKGSQTLDVCMERMIETGVVSEAAYDKADGHPMATRSTRYKISGFEKMNPNLHDQAFHKLDHGIVLVATFGITKGYFNLKAGDVYDIPKDAVFETGLSGNKLTHAVVIVGYGLTPEGLPYYAFQNSYGPGWGNGGFGMVTCRSIKQLYSASL